MGAIKNKRLLAAVLTAALAVFSSGCARNQTEPPAEPDDVKPAESTVKSEDTGNIQMVDQPMPDFLADVPKADVLSDVRYRSFDPAAILYEPERQPINGYKCTGFFNNLCYIYKEGDGYGVLSLSGEILLEPEGVTKITAESPEILAVRRTDKPRELYRVSYDGLTLMQDKKFDASRITFEPEGESPAGLLLRVDGRDIYSAEWTHWRSASQVDLAELDTETNESEFKYEAVFLAENDKGKYYLAFDRFFNMTVCSAELGFAEMKIGDRYGGFYITDQTDYEDLTTLVSAFGDETASAAPPKGGSGSDYIRLVFGRDGDTERSVYTISPEGYCFAEVTAGESVSRYFRKMSPDTFTDLVYWVDKKLNKHES